MDMNAIRQLSVKEIGELLESSRAQMQQIPFQRAPQLSGEIRELELTIARCITVLKEKGY